MSQDQRPNNVVNLQEAEITPRKLHNIYAYGMDPLGQKMASEKLGFHVGVLEPKSFLCPYHSHDSEEELLLILEGEATIRQNDETFIVRKDDLIFYKLNVTHQIYNHTDQPCRVLTVANKDPNDVCVYPDSGKINFRRHGKIFQEGKEVDYFTDEKEPSSFWQDQE